MKTAAIFFLFSLLAVNARSDVIYGRSVVTNRSVQYTQSFSIVANVGESTLEVASVTVPPGATQTVNFSFNGEGVTAVYGARYRLVGTRVGASFVGTGVAASDVQFLGPQNVELSSTAAAANPSTFDLVDFNFTPDAAKTLWELEDTTLTANLFREGVDKIVASNGYGSNTGGATAGTTTNSEQLAGAAIQANQLVDFTDLTPAVSKDGMQSAGNDQADLLRSILVDGREAPTSLAYDPGHGTTPASLLTFSDPWTGHTWDFNPFTSERLGPILSWFRSAVAWITLMALALWVFKAVDTKIYQVSQVQQARGNTVAAGTGAQATSLAAAGLITAAIVVFVTGLVSWSFGEISLTFLYGTLSSNPLASIGQGVLWMLDQMLPVATLITAVVARVTFYLYATPLYLTASAIVRFIVP